MTTSKSSAILSPMAAVIAAFCIGNSHADVFTNVPEASAYQVVYDLAVPAVHGRYNHEAIPYTTDDSANWPAGSFTRVAYYLELSGSTDATRPNGFVWVSFDVPGALHHGRALGVPSNGSNGSRVVSNASVTSTACRPPSNTRWGSTRGTTTRARHGCRGSNGSARTLS